MLAILQLELRSRTWRIWHRWVWLHLVLPWRCSMCHHITIQEVNSGKFEMFDYGKAGNQEAYGTVSAVDITSPHSLTT